ncbi:Polyisoprenoid-binding protein YceI [Formosa sp. Hel1_31_208]|uniref:YceI family protein n=1 Tax=Formosa sp. Hel1_31_208 TaxID=1798225 RepID=UPI0008797CD7|nr:YceI family protein [Formosa sp. Hel1_31_208]SDS60687.1 Polyisoprenoid-binding protein YceI [Formosa sp. Hel1_31_208]
MKTKFLKLSLLLTIILTFSNCKDKADAATISEAEEAAKSENTSEKYTVNVVESSIHWKGFKPTGTHMGTIKLQNGFMNAIDGTLESGSFEIDMTSINVTDLESGDGKESLEAHLMGTVEGKEGDFFNVNEFPTAAFEITGITPMDNGITKLSGNLTIKGKKQNISFPVNIYPEGDSMIIKSEPFLIDRTLWGINYGSKSIFDNLGDKFINDDMELQIVVIAKKA